MKIKLMSTKNISLDRKNILRMDPTDLADWIVRDFSEDIPQQICSKEEMDRAAELLLRLTNIYSYLNSLLSYVKIAVREMKRSNDKSAYEDMVDRKEIIQNATDNIKQQYAAVSRAVTIRMENNRELMMENPRANLDPTRHSAKPKNYLVRVVRG